MIERQWHQLDHMQIICILLQTDNHASISSLNFLQSGCSSWCPTNSVIVLKAKQLLTTTTLHPFNGFFSRTTWVIQQQNDKPFWILLEQEMMGWQWYQLDHMQIICTSLQTDNHASNSPLSFYRPDALPATQPSASKH